MTHFEKNFPELPSKRLKLSVIVWYKYNQKLNLAYCKREPFQRGKKMKIVISYVKNEKLF